MKKKFEVGQKVIWETDDFDGTMEVSAVITEIYQDHCIAVSQGNKISNLNGLTLWIDESTEQYFHVMQRNKLLH